MIATTWGGKGFLISEVERMVLGKCVLFIEVSSARLCLYRRGPLMLCIPCTETATELFEGTERCRGIWILGQRCVVSVW